MKLLFSLLLMTSLQVDAKGLCGISLEPKGCSIDNPIIHEYRCVDEEYNDYQYFHHHAWPSGGATFYQRHIIYRNEQEKPLYDAVEQLFQRPPSGSSFKFDRNKKTGTLYIEDKVFKLTCTKGTNEAP